MTTVPETGKNKGPLLNPALCRCCRSIKKCRVLTTEYEWMGKKEVYSDMFMDCFGLLLSHLDGEDRDLCICATCVVRLREACAFRQQVLQSEEVFLTSKDVDRKIMVEVKAEPLANDDSDSQNDDRDDIVDSYTQETDTLNPDEIDIKKEDVKSNKDAPTKAIETNTSMKKELYTKMQKLRDKLDEMLDKPVITAPKRQMKLRKTISEKKKRVEQKPAKKLKSQDKEKDDHDNMVYQNAVTIVHNSYVCPFHNRISNYYCYYCKDQFTNPNELREHTLTHNPKALFESMMENKSRIPKIDIKRIDCRLCPEKINDLQTFKTHITTVHNKSLFPVKNEFLTFRLDLDNVHCTECDCTFPYFDLLKKHMIEHFGTFICDMCGACFLEQNSLRTHIKSHNKVESIHPCEICGKNLKSKYSKYLHVATVHEKKPTVNCYKCEASFMSYALRNRHLIEVHGDKRTFPCKLCDKVYNRRKTLMEHNRRNHLKVYRHQCDLCDQRFYLPSRLKEHMATHTGERNFRCEYCDKSYPRLQSLQEHIRSHSNERRFKCDICNSTFTQNGSLKTHMRSHHQFEIEGSYS